LRGRKVGVIAIILESLNQMKINLKI